MTELQLDPRWEWTEVEVPEMGRAEVRVLHVKGKCKHLEIVPVEAVTGDVVAQLCQTCDAQLPAPRV